MVRRGRSPGTLGNCRQPGYQSNLFTVDSPEPWFQLTFVSDAAGWMNENGSGPVRSLYSCRLDGSQVRRLSFNLSDDLDPFLMGDGRILYASWQRATLDRGPLGRMALFGINIEGHGQRVVRRTGRANGSSARRVSPIAVWCCSSKSDEVTVDGYGQIGSVTFRRPLKSYRAVTTERMALPILPLRRGRRVACLISRRPVDRSGTSGLCVFDPKTVACQVLLDDPAYDEVQGRGSARHSSTRWTIDGGGRHAAVGQDVLSECLDPRSARRVWLPRGNGQTCLRVLEGIPLTVQELDAHLPVSSTARAACTERHDAQWSAPDCPAAIVGRDGHQPGRIVPHQRAGQHTDRAADARRRRSGACVPVAGSGPRTSSRGVALAAMKMASRRPRTTSLDALKHPAVALTLPPERRRTVDFRRDVMPIIEAEVCRVSRAGRRAATARRGPGSGGRAERIQPGLHQLAGGTRSVRRGVGGGPVRASGSRTDQSVDLALLGRNTSRPWDGERGQWPAGQVYPTGEAAAADEPGDAGVRRMGRPGGHVGWDTRSGQIFESLNQPTSEANRGDV